jgi:hypothetical protein
MMTEVPSDRDGTFELEDRREARPVLNGSMTATDVDGHVRAHRRGSKAFLPETLTLKISHH